MIPTRYICPQCGNAVSRGSYLEGLDAWRNHKPGESVCVDCAALNQLAEEMELDDEIDQGNPVG